MRRDPVDQPVLTVADVSCNIHAAFPNAEYVAKMAKLDPDLLAFTGDQFYESTGGYGVIRTPLDPAMLDYLRKWYMHGWTWRELNARPAERLDPRRPRRVSGEHLGRGGRRPARPRRRRRLRHAGRVGQRRPPHADVAPSRLRYDPAPVKQGIIDVLRPADVRPASASRSSPTGSSRPAPEGKVPPTGGRGDHVTDPNFDPEDGRRAGRRSCSARGS